MKYTLQKDITVKAELSWEEFSIIRLALKDRLDLLSKMHVKHESLIPIRDLLENFQVIEEDYWD